MMCFSEYKSSNVYNYMEAENISDCPLYTYTSIIEEQLSL